MEQLDVTGLPPEDVNLLKQLLERLKAKVATEPAAAEVTYRSWPLGVKEPITRAEISTMTSADPLLLDTNVLVYAADQTSPHHEASRDVRDRGRVGELNLCLTPQVLFEFYAVVTDSRRVAHPLTPEEATSELAQYFADPTLRKIHPGPDIGQLVLDLLRRYPVAKQHVFDLALVAVMLANDVGRICTYDSAHFERFAEIETLSPAAL